MIAELYYPTMVSLEGSSSGDPRLGDQLHILEKAKARVERQKSSLVTPRDGKQVQARGLLVAPRLGEGGRRAGGRGKSFQVGEGSLSRYRCSGSRTISANRAAAADGATAAGTAAGFEESRMNPNWVRAQVDQRCSATCNRLGAAAWN